jgi:hypothetical protein
LQCRDLTYGNFAAGSLAADFEQLGPSLPDEVIRHTRLDQVIQSFTEHIWSEMGRCVNCHSPERNRTMVGRDGHAQDEVDAISSIVPRNPAATLRKLFDTGNIDLNDPTAIVVLTKPVGRKVHRPSPKFALGRNTDKNFRHFLINYAAVVKGDYRKTNHLPVPTSDLIAETGQHLRIIELPRELDGKLLKVEVFSQADMGLASDRVASAENPVNGKQCQWQSAIYAVAMRDSEAAEKLVPDQALATGRYVAKIFVDRKDQTKMNRDYELAESDYMGQVEFSGAWKVGYREPKIGSLKP